MKAGKPSFKRFIENGPYAGKLQPGDQIISVREADQIYDTQEMLQYHPWGLNPGVNIHVQVQRDGELFEYDITPVIDKGCRWPQTKEQINSDMQEFYAENPESHRTLDYLVEEFDQVACIVSVTGTNQKYNNRPYSYSAAYLFQFLDGRIVSLFEEHNTKSQVMQQGFRILPPERVPVA